MVGRLHDEDGETGRGSFLHPEEFLERQDASTDFTYRQMRRHFWMEGGLLEKLLLKKMVSIGSTTQRSGVSTAFC